MEIVFSVIQIIVSFLVIGLVLLQPPSDEAGGASLAASKTTRRGWDKVMFTITVFVTITFVVLSFFRMVAPNI